MLKIGKAKMNNLVEKIEASVIGSDQLFSTAFGQKPMIYADYTASGRSLNMIEDYLRNCVLPWYANTHTDTSFTGAQTTALREESREIIRKAVNGSDKDKVIFCGPGATTGINKLIDILNIRLPKELNEKYKFEQQIPAEQRPVVFVGPYEHHSNELPWRESIADVVAIPLSTNGQIDTDILATELAKYKDRPLKIGSFSAASNVTGVISDVQGIAAILKQHGALSFWDYAAAGPYLPIDMNGETAIDAVFISPHKFIGGPGTTGVLIVKEHVLTNKVPAIVGGGTVLYVTPDGHRFIADHERREEGGTPAIVESIRTGLVFKLQQEVSLKTIQQKEHEFVERALARFNAMPNIQILGNTDVDRLSIFSFRVKHQGKDLHYGFVTALLNDLFGIQVRGGCSCAGPYGHTLLDMSADYSANLEAQIQQGEMVLRPGWVRANFNYFITESEFEYIINAIELVAEHGWRLLPFYQLDQEKTVWRFQGKHNELATSLNAFSFAELTTETIKSNSIPDHQQLLAEAKSLLTQGCSSWHSYPLSLSEGGEALRWFSLPQECEQDLG